MPEVNLEYYNIEDEVNKDHIDCAYYKSGYCEWANANCNGSSRCGSRYVKKKDAKPVPRKLNYGYIVFYVRIEGEGISKSRRYYLSKVENVELNRDGYFKSPVDIYAELSEIKKAPSTLKIKDVYYFIDKITYVTIAKRYKKDDT